jgi:DNA topoisomerase-1
VGEISQARRERKPYPPYITSSMQRDASARLHWPAKKVMEIAQQLYEGVTLPGEGQVGLITYMRTDSTQVAPEAQREARTVIERLYGAEALPATPPRYDKKVKNAQEAHEAIRPTKPERLPAQVRGALTPDQDKLYTLIWRRFMASQMKPAVYHVTTVTIYTGRDGKRLPYIFRATGRELLDPGFLRVYDVAEDAPDADAAHNEQLPPLAEGDDLICHQLLPQQHFTTPPPRFTDAALIAELERLGIGRPSTFASIVDTLYQRAYVERVPAGRALQSTELGRVVCDFLLRHFPTVFEVGFTARLEDQLDDIANGEARWTAVMAQLWDPLSSLISHAQAAVAGAPRIRVAAATPTSASAGDEAETPPARRRGSRGGRKTAGRAGRPRATGSKRAGKGARRTSKRSAKPTDAPGAATGQPCPECGRPLVQRTSQYGPFLGCSGFPNCRYIQKTPRGQTPKTAP